MSMFRTAQQLRNVVTLFHDAAAPRSVALTRFIESRFPNPKDLPFELDVTTAKPTKEQADILGKLAPRFADEFKNKGVVRPTLVDWFNSRIAVDDEAEAKKILEDAAAKKDE